MSAAGTLPDWGKPVGSGPGQVFMAHGNPRSAFAPPIGLKVEREDGRPGYSLAAFRLQSSDGLLGFGSLTLRVVGAYDLAERQATLLDDVAVQLRPMPLTSGWGRLSPTQVLDWPPLEPAEFVSAGAGVTSVMRLTADAAAAFRVAAEGGIIPLAVVADILLKGMAPRLAAKARLEGNALCEGLLANRDGRWSRTGLATAIGQNAFSRSLEWSEQLDEDATAHAAEALADRLLTRAFSLVPPDTAETEPFWQLQQQELQDRILEIDLADETIAARAIRLQSGQLISPDMSEQVLAVSAPPVGVETGFEALTIDANLPPRLVGAIALGAEIRVPANPPARPQTIVRTVRLADGSAATPVTLRLAPDEPLQYTYRTAAFISAGNAPQRVDGPERHGRSRHLIISPDDFNVAMDRVEATSSLLAAGDVVLRWAAAAEFGQWAMQATLTKAAPSVAVLRPSQVTDLALEAELVSPSGERLGIPVEPGTSLWLDLSSLPQAGPQQAQIGAMVEGAEITIECIPQDAEPGARGSLLRLTEAQPQATFRWLPVDPFRSGFHCRWAVPAGPAREWSPVYPGGAQLFLGRPDLEHSRWPGDAIMVSANAEQLEIDGLTIVAESPGIYVYRARAPRLARNAADRPALNVMAAGDVSYVQLTAQWVATPDLVQKATEALKARDGSEPTLRPAPDSVRETALLVGPQADNLSTVATGTALGAPPQTSVLAAQLDAAQTALVRRAIAGERGLVRLRYVIDAADPTQSSTTFSAESRSPGGSSSVFREVGESGFERHTINADADLADLMTA